MTSRIFKQNYDDLKARCVRDGSLFEDPEFPARDTAIFYTRQPSAKKYDWKRPSEICSNPQFVVDGASRFDVKQGELDNSWFVSAVSSLALDKNLFEQVVNVDQTFSRNYGGIFRFTFWVQGEWQDVVVDDRLPTINGELCFAHSGTKNEFWFALLEKAYAKLYRSYENLKDGSLSEALVDFTSGVTEIIDLNKSVPSDLVCQMLKAAQRSSLMGCFIEAESKKEQQNGLVVGQNYSVTDVKLVETRMSRREGKVPMVRLRSPKGDGTEWKGAWSDKSREWSSVGDNERIKIGLTFDHDGEFWMSFEDFQFNFDVLEMCHLGPESALETNRTSFASRRENGSWVRRTTAGGCRNYINTFWTNPQYCVNITDPDEDDDENRATAWISLMQKDRRAQRRLGKQNLNIGFYIYKLPAGASKEPLGIDFFKQHASEHTSGFKEAREVCCRYKLTPGTYVIVPCTFEPQEEGDFLLRIFSEIPMSIEELDEPNSRTRPGEREVPESSEEDKRMEEKLRATFLHIAGSDHEIDAWELQEILNGAFGSEFPMSRGFSIGKCKSIVAMVDNDMTGKLGFQEFQEFWNDLRLWKGVFKKYDADRSGLMTSYELRNALASSGFRISNGTLTAATMRHSNRKGDIEFPDFVLLMVQLSRATDLFNDSKTAQGKAQFSLDEFLNISIYN